jgi:hypothetical protein
MPMSVEVSRVEYSKREVKIGKDLDAFVPCLNIYGYS